MNAFKWSDNAPPYNTWVWASYGKNFSLVKTCKRGCCVHSSLGTMVLPNLWYLASIEEGIKEQKLLDNMPQIDLSNIY